MPGKEFIKEKLMEIIEPHKENLKAEEIAALELIFDNEHPFAIMASMLAILMAMDDKLMLHIVSIIGDIKECNVQITFLPPFGEKDDSSNKTH